MLWVYWFRLCLLPRIFSINLPIILISWLGTIFPYFTLNISIQYSLKNVKIFPFFLNIPIYILIFFYIEHTLKAFFSAPSTKYFTFYYTVFRVKCEELFWNTNTKLLKLINSWSLLTMNITINKYQWQNILLILYSLILYHILDDCKIFPYYPGINFKTQKF